MFQSLVRGAFEGLGIARTLLLNGSPLEKREFE
jgi:hypothetical protein